MRAHIESAPYKAHPNEVLRARQLPEHQLIQFAKISTTEELYYLMQRFAFGVWQDAERVIFFFDDSGRIVVDLLQLYINNEWVDDDRFIYEYEGDSPYPSVVTWQEWDANESDWVNLERDLLVFDEHGRETEIIIELWDDEGNEWIAYDRTVITYTEDGNYLEILSYYWGFDDWELDYRVRWIYEDGRLVQEIEEYWDGEEWWVDFRILYEYDDQGNNIAELYQYYDDFEEEWVNDARYLYSHNTEGNQTESVYQWWDEDEEVWKNLTRTTSEYDNRNNHIRDTYYAWGGEDWIPSIRMSMHYDQNDELQMIVFEGWINEEWRYEERYLFGGFDPTYVVVDEGLPQRFELMQNYPNPFNPSTTIRFSIPEQSGVSLTVYDVLGRKIAVLIDDEMNAGTYAHVFDASRLASGVYLYQLRTGEYIEMKRLILMK